MSGGRSLRRGSKEEAEGRAGGKQEWGGGRQGTDGLEGGGRREGRAGQWTTMTWQNW